MTVVTQGFTDDEIRQKEYLSFGNTEVKRDIIRAKEQIFDLIVDMSSSFDQYPEGRGERAPQGPAPNTNCEFDDLLQDSFILQRDTMIIDLLEEFYAQF